MRVMVRSLYLAIFTALSAMALAWASTISSAITLVDNYAIIMGGTDTPNPEPEYVDNVAQRYIFPFSNICSDEATCELTGIYTPEQLWPFFGGWSAMTFDDSVATGVELLDAAVIAQRTDDPASKIHVLGFSQSAAIVAAYMRRIHDPDYENPPFISRLEFTVIGDAGRPNGGILMRLNPLGIPFAGITFDGVMPTDTFYKVTDIGFEYDPISDFPLYVTNPLAILNSVMALKSLHGSYPYPVPTAPDGYPWGFPPPTTEAELQAAMADPANVYEYAEYPDNTYILIPAKTLPLLQPARDFAAATGTTAVIEPVLRLVEPTLRVLIDLGYDRSIPFAEPTRAKLIPLVNPLTVAKDLVDAASEGIDDAFGGAPAHIATLSGSKPDLTSALTAAAAADEPLARRATDADEPLARRATDADEPLARRATDADEPLAATASATDPDEPLAATGSASTSEPGPNRPRAARPPHLPGITGPRSPLNRLFHGADRAGEAPAAAPAGEDD